MLMELFERDHNASNLHELNWMVQVEEKLRLCMAIRCWGIDESRGETVPRSEVVVD